jgi:hypothetical protein
MFAPNRASIFQATCYAELFVRLIEKYSGCHTRLQLGCVPGRRRRSDWVQFTVLVALQNPVSLANRTQTFQTHPSCGRGARRARGEAGEAGEAVPSAANAYFGFGLAALAFLTAEVPVRTAARFAVRFTALPACP